MSTISFLVRSLNDVFPLVSLQQSTADQLRHMTNERDQLKTSVEEKEKEIYEWQSLNELLFHSIFV